MWPESLLRMASHERIDLWETQDDMGGAIASDSETEEDDEEESD